MFRASEGAYHHRRKATAQLMPLRYYTHPEENSASKADC